MSAIDESKELRDLFHESKEDQGRDEDGNGAGASQREQVPAQNEYTTASIGFSLLALAA